MGSAASTPGTDRATVTTVTTALAIGSATLDAAAARSKSGGGTLGTDAGMVSCAPASSDVNATAVETLVVASDSFLTSVVSGLITGGFGAPACWLGFASEPSSVFVTTR